MSADYNNLYLATIDAFGQNIIVTDKTMLATVENGQQLDERAGIYIDVMTIEYIERSAPVDIRRGTKFEVDGRQMAAMQNPIVTDGWVTCVLTKI